MASSVVCGRKLALVIGINKYPEWRALKMCVKDATDLKEVLNSIGFKVTPKFDCNIEDFKKTVEDFTASVNQNDIVLFYYAGHGKESDGVNYLLPANYNYIPYSTIKEAEYITANAINAQDTLNNILQKRPRIVILILDCCRVPLESRSIDVPRLNTMITKPETFVAYSCASGAIALDKASDGQNGAFAKHLLKHIRTPDVDIEVVLKNVARDVKAETNGIQSPYRTSGLTDEFYLTTNRFEENEFATPGTYEALRGYFSFTMH